MTRSTTAVVGRNSSIAFSAAAPSRTRATTSMPSEPRSAAIPSTIAGWWSATTLDTGGPPSQAAGLASIEGLQLGYKQVCI